MHQQHSMESFVICDEGYLSDSHIAQNTIRPPSFSSSSTENSNPPSAPQTPAGKKPKRKSSFKTPNYFKKPKTPKFVPKALNKPQKLVKPVNLKAQTQNPPQTNFQKIRKSARKSLQFTQIPSSKPEIAQEINKIRPTSSQPPSQPRFQPPSEAPKSDVFDQIPGSAQIFSNKSSLVIPNLTETNIGLTTAILETRSSLLPQNVNIHKEFSLIEYHFGHEAQLYTAELAGRLSAKKNRKIIKRILKGIYALSRSEILVNQFQIVVNLQDLRPYLVLPENSDCNGNLIGKIGKKEQLVLGMVSESVFDDGFLEGFWRVIQDFPICEDFKKCVKSSIGAGIGQKSNFQGLLYHKFITGNSFKMYYL